MRARIFINWTLDAGTPIEGVTGVNGESIPVDKLVRWARRRRRQLRRDIRRGIEANRRARISRGEADHG